MSQNTISDIGTDLAKLMLNALIQDGGSGQPESKKISIADQKKLLIQKIGLLDEQEKFGIGRIVILNGFRGKICECKEGSVINLDTLPEEIVNQMYDKMIFFLRKKQT